MVIKPPKFVVHEIKKSLLIKKTSPQKNVKFMIIHLITATVEESLNISHH